jgi:flagellar basal-body rod modification protein FlgD
MDVFNQLSGVGNTAASAGNAYSQLSSEDFAKIIFTELSKQDPLQPNDTNALLEQISNIRSIQSDMDLTDRLSSLVDQSEFSAASTLIGKTVSGVSAGNSRVAGVVVSVSRTPDGAFVTLRGGERVPMTNLDVIRESEEAGQ